MSEEERTRMIGVRDGLVHALLSVKSIRGSITGPRDAYLPPKNHTRKLAAVEARLSEIDKIHAAIQRNLNNVNAALSA